MDDATVVESQYSPDDGKHTLQCLDDDRDSTDSTGSGSRSPASTSSSETSSLHTSPCRTVKVTGYRLAVTLVTFVLGSVKVAASFKGQAVTTHWLDWGVGVALTILYVHDNCWALVPKWNEMRTDLSICQVSSGWVSGKALLLPGMRGFFRMITRSRSWQLCALYVGHSLLHTRTHTHCDNRESCHLVHNILRSLVCPVFGHISNPILPTIGSRRNCPNPGGLHLGLSHNAFLLLCSVLPPDISDAWAHIRVCGSPKDVL
jgi:hypothetical protein